MGKAHLGLHAVGRVTSPGQGQRIAMRLHRHARHILMAKRGQRPQHWVPWEAVCENVATHKINVIFEIKMVMRK